MRINARLDAETERQLRYLMESTGLSVSDVVKSSLAHYYEAVWSDRPPQLARLLAVAGSKGSGRSDISLRTKQALTESLTAKHRAVDGGSREPKPRKSG
jgi:hypothetical protein